MDAIANIAPEDVGGFAHVGIQLSFPHIPQEAQERETQYSDSAERQDQALVLDMSERLFDIFP